jgi:tetratricopeptide (TPR) repeat protein
MVEGPCKDGRRAFEVMKGEPNMKTAKSARRPVRAGRAAVILAAWIGCAWAPPTTAQVSPGAGSAPATTEQQPAGPEPGQYWFDQGQLQEHYQMSDEAQKCYAKAIATAQGTPIKIQAYESWGDLLERRKLNEEAAGKFYKAQALADDPERKWRLLQRSAQNLETAGKTDQAGTQYQVLMKTGRRPGEREWARDRICDLYRRLQKPEELYRIFENMARSDPQDAMALQTLFWLYRDVKGDYAAAHAPAVKLMAIKGDDVQVILQLADLEVRLKNTEQAISLYEKLCGSHPEQRATCYDAISNAWFQAGQPQNGFEWAEKAAQVEPQTMSRWIHCGDLYYWNGQAEKSLGAYAKADSLAQTEGDHDNVKLHVANAYRELKRDAQAIVMYKELCDNPKSPVRDQAKHELIELYSRRGMLDKLKIDVVEPPAPPAPK